MAKQLISEKMIERQILEYLSIIGVFVLKINNVGVYDPVKKVYRLPKSPYIRKGVSDIIGIYRGLFLAIEVKTPKRRKMVSEDQQNFLDAVKLHGGIAFVATSLEEVKDHLLNLE